MIQTVRNKGSALIAVVLFLILLAGIAGAIMKLTKANAISGSNRLNMYTLQYAAEGGINRAIYQLVNSNQREIDDLHARTIQYDFDGISVSVSLKSEAGKIDINIADENLLRSVFSWAGVGEEETRSIAQKIIDWRDEGSARMPYGAEASDYVLAGYDYTPRNLNFQTVGELTQVMSVERSKVGCIAPFLTVYTGQSSPSRKHASKSVEEIMDLAIGENGVEASRGLLRRSGVGANRVLSLIATAIKGDNKVSLRAVVRVTGNPQNPYYIHLWRLVEGEDVLTCQQK